MRIAFAGDFFRSQGSVAELDPSLFVGCDHAFVNLEGPVTHGAQPIQKTGPNVRMGTDALDHLVEAGVTGVTLANNHILDHGLAGLAETLDHCQSRGLLTVGAATAPQGMGLPLVLDQDGLSVAILSFAEQEWNNVNGVGANITSTVGVARALRKAALEHDACVLVLHGGNEHYPLPSPETLDQLRFFAESGASAILMHHSHCMSGSEVWKGVPIYYGLGNLQFTLPSASQHWYLGLVVQIQVERSGSVGAEHSFVRIDPATFDATTKLDRSAGEAFGERSAIISDDSLLLERWKHYMQASRLQYLQLMTPAPGNGRQSYRARGALASGFTSRMMTTQALWLNAVRCAAHRSVLEGVLQESLTDSGWAQRT